MQAQRQNWEAMANREQGVGGIGSSRAGIPTTLVELSVSCQNLINKDTLTKSDPQCFLYTKDEWRDNFVLVDKTELIKDSLNPKFVKKFLVNYNFESIQKLKFEIFDVDEITENDFLGSLEITLGEIVSHQGNELKRPLKGPRRDSGNIILVAEEVTSCRQVAVFQFRATNLKRLSFWCSNDPFYTISRANEDNSQTVVFKSEICNSTSNPSWKAVTARVRNLCNGDYDRSLTFNCYDHRQDGDHALIGSFTTTLGTLKTATEKLFELRKPKKDKIYGTFELVSIRLEEEVTFLDYLKGGLEIHFAVAIDFTASNGNPQDSTSLHYLDVYHHVPNAYEIALRSVGEIIQQYSSTGMFPAFGFGAKVNGQVSHQFPLNGNPSHPYCQNIEELIGFYKHNITTVALYGPTNFSPVINNTASIAAQFQDGKRYFVLLIITDGIISDMQQTKTSIVDASKYPLSIIIVGVGNADFSAMDELDCDEGRLSSNGQYAERDIVQFVPLNRYLANGRQWQQSQYELAQEVLREVPDQVVLYMKKRGFKPQIERN